MDSSENKASQPAPEEQPATGETVTTGQTTDATDTYTYHDDYGYDHNYDTPQATESNLVPAPAGNAPPPTTPTPPNSDEDDDPDDDGMLRMSFLDHLEELRARLIRIVAGVGVAFVLSLYFVNDLWQIVQAPAQRALELNGVNPARLSVLSATEAFSVIWVKLPILTAVFLSSPWTLWQVWAFIAPGLYKKERKWAAPFVICTAGLFIAGGMFAYYVAFRLGLAFLLGIAVGNQLNPVVSISDYFDLFINVSLGLGLVFELPVLIFFLALLRIVTAGFLVRNSRYAILLIVVVAALITPTPDVINLMLISVPMTALYFTGVFAAYLLTLSREEKKFPWGVIALIVLGMLIIGAITLWAATARFGYTIQPEWPYLTK